MSGQAIEFEFRLDEGEFAALTQKLHELSGNKARTYIARALNKTATSARVKLANKAQASYTVKSGGFKKDARIEKASAGNLTAYIKSEGKPLDIVRFKSAKNTPKKGGAGAKADIVRSGLKQIHASEPKAFKATKKGHGQIFYREGKARTPILKVKSKSVPYMLGNDQRVWSPTRPQIESDLKKFMQQQIKQLVG